MKPSTRTSTRTSDAGARLVADDAGRPGVGEPSAAAIAAAECAAFLLAHPSDADPATGIEYGGLS